MSKRDNLTDFLTNTAQAINTAANTSDEINAQDFEDRIKALSLENQTKDADALAEHILSGKTAYVDGNKITGTYTPSNVSGTKSITTTDTVDVSSYRYAKVADADLVSANIKSGVNILGVGGTFTNDANATAADILRGQIAYVKGEKITGTMPDYPDGRYYLNAGEQYNIPEGYHYGAEWIEANSLADQTPGTATSSDILSGKTAYVRGEQVTGERVDPGSRTIQFTSDYVANYALVEYINPLGVKTIVQHLGDSTLENLEYSNGVITIMRGTPVFVSIPDEFDPPTVSSKRAGAISWAPVTTHSGYIVFDEDVPDDDETVTIRNGDETKEIVIDVTVQVNETTGPDPEPKPTYPYAVLNVELPHTASEQTVFSWNNVSFYDGDNVTYELQVFRADDDTSTLREWTELTNTSQKITDMDLLYISSGLPDYSNWYFVTLLFFLSAENTQGDYSGTTAPPSLMMLGGKYVPTITQTNLSYTITSQTTGYYYIKNQDGSITPGKTFTDSTTIRGLPENSQIVAYAWRPGYLPSAPCIFPDNSPVVSDNSN